MSAILISRFVLITLAVHVWFVLVHGSVHIISKGRSRVGLERQIVEQNGQTSHAALDVRALFHAVWMQFVARQMLMSGGCSASNRVAPPPPTSLAGCF